MFVKLAPDMFMPTNSMYSLYNVSIMCPHCHLAEQNKTKQRKMNASSRNTQNIRKHLIVSRHSQSYSLLGRISSLSSRSWCTSPFLLVSILLCLFIRQLYSFAVALFMPFLCSTLALFLTLFFCSIVALFVYVRVVR